MGVSLKELRKNVKDAEVMIGEETINITFRPGEFTDGFFDHINGEDNDVEGTNYALKTLLVSWDIEDEGKPLPINDANLALVPIPVKSAILKTITDNMNVGGDEKKPTAGTFSQRGRRAN